LLFGVFGSCSRDRQDTALELVSATPHFASVDGVGHAKVPLDVPDFSVILLANSDCLAEVLFMRYTHVEQ
jgi:hypothetical protein